MREMSENVILFVVYFYLLPTLIHGSNDNQRKPYIVYMGEVPEAGASISAMDNHHNLLLSAIGDEKIARESRLHSYGKSFNAFAARLSPDEAKRLSEKENVVSVFPNTMRKLRTTRSWDFLGMPEPLKQRNPNVESNIILGVLDTGIYVEAPSFNDKGYGPPPPKWKGQCAKGANFSGCNNKVIGARYYNLGNRDPDPDARDESPTDTEGHGTHTSSTAAGIPVKGASLYGIAEGTARGGVPMARIAMYKVCGDMGCSDMDLLAGFDDAIADGVDIISVSVGGPSKHFFDDSIAIGSFHAMKKGILTSCAAGNSGPQDSTVENTAPWIMTVAATSIDRQFRTEIKLGNGMKFSGISINTYSPGKQMYPLTSGSLAANLSRESYLNASACDYGTLSNDKVKGKIVYCLGTSNQDSTIKELGGAGAIIALDADTDVAYSLVIPGTYVDQKDGEKIDQYINSTKNPQAAIYKTTSPNISAPFVASFSSRGPQAISLNILKPDLSAPGLNILAAYTKLASTTGHPGDTRFTVYNIISGTSMACPHATAAAAYVKTFHPDWSPAAIKSALMTTATPMKVKEADSELGFGSGQINPTRAVHPGLIYDLPLSSYIRFLCKEGYNGTTIGLLTGGKHRYKCSDFRPAEGDDGLNYPSMHLQITEQNSSISANFYRTVKHVGYGKSVYKAIVTSPKGLSIKVVPNTLSFDQLHQKKAFKVVLKGGSMPNGTQILSALLEWNDSKHSVKSPIVVYKQISPY